jgi:hypothetical protein
MAALPITKIIADEIQMIATISQIDR